MNAMASQRTVTITRCAAALLAALLALLAPAAGAAGSSSAPAATEVEIVIFRHLDQRGNSPEVPPMPTQPGGAAPTPTAPAGVRMLAPASLRLADVVARLRRASAYQVLYHGGWSQPVESQQQATPSPLPADAQQAGLSGTITLYRERYLHALVDISLPATGNTAEKDWHIRQGRRLRGNALQYFDHPAFGMILAVRVPAGTDEAEPASTTDEER